MNDKDDLFPVGSTCVSVARAFFSYRGEIDRSRGAVEFCWRGGAATTIDTRADWTLYGEPARWMDPYRDLDASGVEEIHQEFGIWRFEDVVSPDPLSSVVGGRLLGVARVLDEMDFWMDLDLLFDTCLVRLQSWEGDVRPIVSDL